ncbi:MAG: histidine kinase dimerization/phospho-acceptor domain-containing protein [Caldilineaceae bacterium]
MNDIQPKRALEEERAHLAQARCRTHRQSSTAANAEPAQTARHKRRVSGGMSHELRTPLNTILGAAELLLEEVYGPLSRMQRTRLRNIEESGQHLLEPHSTKCWTWLAGLERAGKLQLETEPVDIENTCEASLRLIQQAAHRRDCVSTWRPTMWASSKPMDAAKLNLGQSAEQRRQIHT